MVINLLPLKSSSLIELMITVLVPLLLLFLSVDSPYYELWGRIDSSWYFTCGKAWMNGMVPYVDFTDSKGPLLWFIYGVGYFLSNYNYVGVWVLTCIAYVATIILNYRTAHIFLKSDWMSLVVALLMVVVYFNIFIHYETKTEDFCQPFIALSLFNACRLAYSAPTAHCFKKGAWLIGLSIGATLMMKFTIAAMISFFAIMLVVLAKRSKLIDVKKVVWRLFAGMIVVCLPFVIAFAFMGNLDDFIKEYFFVTSSISSHSPRLNVLKWVLGGGLLSGLIIIMALSTGSVFLLVRKYAWMPVLAFFWFLLITVQNAEWVYYYYSCMIYGLFGLIALAKCGERFFHSKVSIVVLLAFCVLALGSFSLYKASQLDNFKLVHHRPNLVFDAERVEYYRHIDIVKKVKQPRIVFYNCNNVINVADETGGLPGCKYFAKQFGATNNMIRSQYEEIQLKRPNFIYVKKAETECLKQIKDLGYFTILEPGDYYKVYLLASPELRELY